MSEEDGTSDARGRKIRNAAALEDRNVMIKAYIRNYVRDNTICLSPNGKVIDVKNEGWIISVDSLQLRMQIWKNLETQLRTDWNIDVRNRIEKLDGKVKTLIATDCSRLRSL
jgi:hypothetical protein